MILALVKHCMTKSIRSFASLALIHIALSYASAAAPTVADAQEVAASGTIDNSKDGPVRILTEYACKQGTDRKTARGGLVSVVMERGSDKQPMRVLGVKGKTGEVAFVHVLDADCSGEQPVAAPGARLALAHKAPGGDEYFYAISDQAECLRAFQVKFLGQLVPVDTNTKIQVCQNEVRIWLSQAAKWKAQANSAAKTKH
jgi:hypothetical protein